MCSFNCRIPRTRVEIEQDYQDEKDRKRAKKKIKQAIKNKDGKVFSLMSTSEQKSSLETSTAFGKAYRMAYFFEKAKGIRYFLIRELFNYRDHGLFMNSDQ